MLLICSLFAGVFQQDAIYKETMFVDKLLQVDGYRMEYDMYVCEQCGKRYKHRATLVRHMRHECGQMPKFKCPYCQASSKQKGHVKEHIIRKHKDMKIYVIDLSLNPNPLCT